MILTRRFFFGLPLCTLIPQRILKESITLRAIAAAEMPDQITIPLIDGDLFELREYSSPQGLHGIFARHGISSVLEEDARFLIPFDSLATRERFWREVGADPDWLRLREKISIRSIALFARG